MAREQHPGPFVASAARADDPPDLAVTFRRYAPYVARIGHRLLGRDDEVDDLIQDVFLAAHTGLESLRDAAAIKGWLATITVRQCRRRLRARKLRAVLWFDSDRDYHDVADDAATPEQRALLASVYRILDQMSANQRIAWALRYVEGEKLERVAELCGCSLATAKRRIKTAQETIQREVAGE